MPLDPSAPALIAPCDSLTLQDVQSPAGEPATMLQLRSAVVLAQVMITDSELEGLIGSLTQILESRSRLVVASELPNGRHR